MFLVALTMSLGCGNETAATTTAPPPVENSEVANILAGLQSGETPDPTPTDVDPPSVPDDVAERAPETATTGSTGGRKNSPECKAARDKRDTHRESIDSYRENDVTAAEKRWQNAEAATQWCMSDLGGCSTDGEKFQDYQVAAAMALKAYENTQFHVGELEAGLYTLDQEIQLACGNVRE